LRIEYSFEPSFVFRDFRQHSFSSRTEYIFFLAWYFSLLILSLFFDYWIAGLFIVAARCHALLIFLHRHSLLIFISSFRFSIFFSFIFFRYRILRWDIFFFRNNTILFFRHSFFVTTITLHTTSLSFRIVIE